MIYIWNSTDENNTLSEFHVDDEYTNTLAFKAQNRVTMDNTVMIQADGYEKETIEYQISGIPTIKSPVVIYSGEIALFIALNLRI